MIQGMYLSFANDTGFLGAAFIPGAADIVGAVADAWEFGINPGGEVAALGPGPMPPEEWCGRLLSREEIEEFDRVMLGEKGGDV